MPSSGALPVYVQISEMLLREIAAGHLLDGERFAPERVMAQEMGVSVGTLRKALSELERKGVLERRQGSGNYVRAIKKPHGVYAFFRLELPQGGGLPTAQVLDVVQASAPEAAGFRQGHRIRRLRSLSGHPIALEEIWLDGAAAGDVRAEDLSESLYLYYKNTLGFWISKAEDRVGMDASPDWGGAAHGVPAGAPCAFVERLSWAQSDAPIEYSRTWFNSERARYVSRLK